MRIINNIFVAKFLVTLTLLLNTTSAFAQNIYSPEDFTGRDTPSTPPPTSPSPRPSPSPNICTVINCLGQHVEKCNLDTNRDGEVNEKDARLVIDYLNTGQNGTPELDVNGDGRTSALDSLLVINYNNSISCPTSPTPTPSTPSTPPPSIPPPVSPSPSPVFTPRPLCEYMAIDVFQTNFDGQESGMDPVAFNKIRSLGTTTQAGSCLNSKLDEALSFCQGTNNIAINNSGDGYLDDCIVEIFMGRALSNTSLPNKAIYLSDYNKRNDQNVDNRRLDKSLMPQNYGFAKSCSTALFNSSRKNYDYSVIQSTGNQCVQGQKLSNNAIVNSISEGKVYFDSNCNSVNYEPQVEESCREDMYYRSSPISLIWETEGDNLLNKTLVQFELDKSKPSHKYCEWKGSSQAPLLVYDPTHSGKINSADQLFGDWTFGGKQIASLSSGNILNSKWDNGFEALSTLDSNKNWSIEGEELNELALWFDENRNGISESGEVKQIKELGVTKLYYKNPTHEPLSKDLVLLLGYERKAGNKVIKGKSIDWYSNTSANPTDLVIVNSLNQNIESNNQHHQNIETNLGKENSDKIISGVWNWKSMIGNDSSKESFGGTLILDMHNDNFEAYSLNERALPKSDKYQMLNEVSLYKMHGRKLSKGSYVLSSIKEENNIETHIQVVKNGLELEGKTTVKNKNGSLTYNWVAERR